jgi:hypothetical protein
MLDALDPLNHVPARLQIMATLAALPDGDALSFTRLQDMIGPDSRQPDHAPAQAGGRRLPQHRQNRERPRVTNLGGADAPGLVYRTTLQAAAVPDSLLTGVIDGIADWGAPDPERSRPASAPGQPAGSNQETNAVAQA